MVSAPGSRAIVGVHMPADLKLRPDVTPRGGAWMATKRAIDLIGAIVCLVVFSPFLLALALAIVIDTGRPVLFRQTRLARGLREFQVLKFRTMKLGASSDMHEEYIKKLATGQADTDN